MTKPTLLLFRSRGGEALAPFMQLHREQHVKCLSQFFRVIVVEQDCDFTQICDEHEADLAVFEMLSGEEFEVSERPRVSNVRGNNDVPKLAFFNADSWCENRPGFYSDMEKLEIETAVTICLTAPERSPGLEGRLFVWPNFIDPDVFLDYGLPKPIPIFISGSNRSLYPWRERTFERLQKSYPSLSSPHFGYADPSNSARMIFGERYARTINASIFVPTCGTLARELVRKHLEIPAARACLVTECTPAVKAAGFADMINCVFADGDDVVDKVDHLLRNPDIREQITDAGYDLVHSQHTMACRDQVFQWFALQRALRPGQRIMQADPFGALSVVDNTARSARWSPLNCRSLDLEMLADGDRCLVSGLHRAAEGMYRKVHEHIPWMPEPMLRLAVVRLHEGDPAEATLWLSRLILHTLDRYGASAPDPEEWKWFIVAMLGLGRTDLAVECANLFPNLGSPNLDRIRIVAEAVGPRGTMLSSQREMTVERASIHQLPAQSAAEALRELCQILDACGQCDIRRRVTDLEPIADDVSSRSLAETNIKPTTIVEVGDADRLRAVALVSRIAARQRRAVNRRPRNLAKRVARIALVRFTTPTLRRRIAERLMSV